MRAQPAPLARSGSGASFYGWRIVGLAFVVDFVAVGFFFYSYGVFFKAIAADLGGGARFDVSLGLALSNAVGASFAPFLGRALDHRSIKRIMIAGAVWVSIGFGLLSLISARWQYFFVLAVFFGFGMTMMGGLSSSKLVANWFVARRGTAFGIATMGVSLSGLVMPAIATWLVAELGWRGGFAVYGVSTLAIVIPLVSRFAVNRPEEMGLRPDGEPPPEAGDPAALAEEAVWSTADVLRSRNFWAIALPFALALAALSAVLIHLVPYADDLGIPSYRAASVVSVSAGAGVLGKVVFGWLVDRVDPRVAVWISLGTQIAGLLLFLLDPSYALLLGGGIVFGFGMGGVIPLHGAVAGMAFGRLSFGKVMGLLRPVQVPLSAVGIPLAGWIFDATGSYDLAFQLFVATYVLACCIVAALRIPRAGARSVSSDGAPGSEARLA